MTVATGESRADCFMCRMCTTDIIDLPYTLLLTMYMILGITWPELIVSYMNKDRLEHRRVTLKLKELRFSHRKTQTMINMAGRVTNLSCLDRHRNILCVASGRYRGPTLTLSLIRLGYLDKFKFRDVASPSSSSSTFSLQLSYIVPKTRNSG